MLCTEHSNLYIKHKNNVNIPKRKKKQKKYCIDDIQKVFNEILKNFST